MSNLTYIKTSHMDTLFLLFFQNMKGYLSFESGTPLCCRCCSWENGCGPILPKWTENGELFPKMLFLVSTIKYISILVTALTYILHCLHWNTLFFFSTFFLKNTQQRIVAT